MSLFATTAGSGKQAAPLAERMRPRTLEEFIGQEELLAPGKPLRRQIESDEVGSMILWGPPGCGKTTLARIIARRTQSEFLPFSAVLSGIGEIRRVMEQAERWRQSGRRTILFVDEVHRFNKAQQDAFLPWVERGSIVLIGATTENPSFEVIGPLLSRTKVYILRALEPDQIVALLERALADAERGMGDRSEYGEIVVDRDLLRKIAVYANGDARAAYNTLEACVLGATPDAAGRRTLTGALIEDVMQRKLLLYDKAGEEHYNLISALHKSVRNSDPDASIYWLARMLESGEDLLYVARRIVRMASEDVGLADPAALGVAIAAMQAADLLGSPEGHLALAEAAVYLALAPKSNAVYTAYGAVQKDMAQTQAEPVPLHLRNPVTDLMKNAGYGRGYQYAHDFEEKTTNMACLPDSLRNRRYYRPTAEGFESRLGKRIEELLRSRAGMPKKQGS
jgi:putative ATPase